jgi:phospholipid transport system transporter-binding protein
MSAQLSCTENTILVQGVIDYRNADALCEQGLSYLNQIKSQAVIDLSALESPSTLVVAVLLRWLRMASAQQCAITLTNVPEKCLSIIRVSGLAAAFSL